MKHVTLRLAMILGALVLVFFALGRLFDSRCEGGKSCIAQTLQSSMAKNGGNFKFSFGDEDSKSRHDEPGDEAGFEGGDVDAELPPTDDVDAIEIRSVSTEWVLRSVQGKMALHFHDVKADRWTISKDGKKLVIDVKPSGAEQAEFDLPATFKGKLRVSTVSGELHIGEVSGLTDLEIDTASGDVQLATWPTEKLELNTVSAEIRIEAANDKLPQSNEILLHSVSGDFDVALKKPFKKLHIQTVSGSMRLSIPKSNAFAYDLHSISGGFDGLPPGGKAKDSFGNKEITGKFGEGALGNIHFESVSGDFNLDQGETVGSR